MGYGETFVLTSCLVQVVKEPAELSQLLAGRMTLLLQPLVVLSQVGHLCQQDHFVLLLLMGENDSYRFV